MASKIPQLTDSEIHAADEITVHPHSHLHKRIAIISLIVLAILAASPYLGYHFGGQTGLIIGSSADAFLLLVIGACVFYGKNAQRKREETISSGLLFDETGKIYLT